MPCAACDTLNTIAQRPRQGVLPPAPETMDLTRQPDSTAFAGDEIGREFATALDERAQAGVEVRLHLDAAAPWAPARPPWNA